VHEEAQAVGCWGSAHTFLLKPFLTLKWRFLEGLARYYKGSTITFFPMEEQGQSRSQTLFVMSVVFLFLVQILLVAPASGVLVGVDGNQFVSINASASNKTILCTSVSQSHCDTDHSVVIGRNNYDNGAVAARFDFQVPKAQCMEDEEFEVRMNIQLNGPNGERGWGQSMTSDEQNYVAVRIRDYEQSSVV